MDRRDWHEWPHPRSDGAYVAILRSDGTLALYHDNKEGARYHVVAMDPVNDLVVEILRLAHRCAELEEAARVGL